MGLWARFIEAAGSGGGGAGGGGAGGGGAGGGGAGGGGAGPPPLVLLHGFTQSAASWAPVVEALTGRASLVLPDAPGHGGSAQVATDLWATADLLAELVPGPAVWAGYSMGGRTALHVALAHPDRVKRLVLISAGAGIDGPAARAARRVTDEELARRIEAEGVDSFLSFWLAQPLFASLGADRAGRESRLVNTAAGLASSLRLAGAGAQEPLWHRLGELGRRRLPVLLIAGEHDARYVDQARRMAAAIGPSATLEVVAGAGHACHLERPAEVAEALIAFCSVALEATGRQS